MTQKGHIRTERERQTEKAYRLKNKEKFKIINKNNKLKSNYGLNPGDYEIMLKNQNGVCAICHQPETSMDSRSNNIKSLAVDHDHETGKVRGLLCQNCNRGIGLLKDNSAILRNAAEYIDSFK